MILHTGNRTDIPAFYSEWFINRLKAGEVFVRNPYDPIQVSRYRITPEVVDVICFCTKNPAPMLAHMEELRNYGQYWYVTITPYGKEIEPNVPPKEKVMEDFICLSKIVGSQAVGWRYDPVFISEVYTVEKHLTDFEQMAKTLCGYTDTCVISFIDLYQKVLRNFPEVKTVPKEDRLRLGKEFAAIAARYGMTVKACAEGRELEPFGVDCDGCMTVELFERAIGCGLNVPKTSGKRARPECACLLGSDIGAYNTCGHLCKYCYANYDAETVLQNKNRHDPDSPLLIGQLRAEDVLHEAKQESWKDGQMRLEL